MSTDDIDCINIGKNIQNDKKLKDKFKIKNLTVQQCEKYFNQLIVDKFKSIVVIDDQSNSFLFSSLNP